MTEPQHGDSVESWTTHTHEIRFICPKCRRMVCRPYQLYYKLNTPHAITCACGQSFGIKWRDSLEDAKVTIHTWVDIDVPLIDDDGDW